VLGLVVIRGFGEVDHLLAEVLRKTDVEGGLRDSRMVRRLDLLYPIVNLSSKPVSACQPGRRVAAEERHHNTDESNQREVKCAVITKAVGTALHDFDRSTNVVSRAKRYAMRTDLVFGRLLGVKRFWAHTIDLLGDIGGTLVLDVGRDTGAKLPLSRPPCGWGRPLSLKERRALIA
jgi:hypothetical protein